MENKNIFVPFIDKKDIKKKADQFRKKYWDNSVPVDIEKIIDVKLGIDVIPVPGLEKICDTNALITSDWSSLYVDKDLYEDERRLNRLRFSYAHEIGHYVLHRGIYPDFDIEDFSDYYRFVENIPIEKYSYLEYQANEFAGNLLVPHELLLIEYEKELKKLNGMSYISNEMALPYVANFISKRFGVSSEVMERILGKMKE